MRLLLTLQHQPNQPLPINYQWLIASWIYRTLEKADPEFSHWLHERGFGHHGKQYKLFTFGNLDPLRYRIDKAARAFVLAQPPTRLLLSFYVDEAIQHFVVGLFKDQCFTLNSGPFRVNFEVVGLEMLPKPNFQNRLRFHLLTPLCVSRRLDNQRYADYLHPDEPDYGELLVRNLLHKQQALQQQTAGVDPTPFEIDFSYRFECLSEPRSKLLTIKGVQVRGFLFDFALTAPAELLEIGYYAGFGEKNSGLGMGMVE